MAIGSIIGPYNLYIPTYPTDIRLVQIIIGNKKFEGIYRSSHGVISDVILGPHRSWERSGLQLDDRIEMAKVLGGVPSIH